MIAITDLASLTIHLVITRIRKLSIQANDDVVSSLPAPEPLIQDGYSVHTLAATQATIVACECKGPKSLSGQLVPPGRL